MVRQACPELAEGLTTNGLTNYPSPECSTKAREEGEEMKTALRIALHVALAMVAVVVFYVGLFMGLQVNTTIGSILWFASGALFVGNLLWLILFLNKRREAAQG